MGIYFHEDGVLFQDRDLELPTNFFSPNFLEGDVLRGMAYLETNMESISFVIDVPMTHHSVRTQADEERVSQTHPSIRRKNQSKVALDDVSFANPAREALRAFQLAKLHPNSRPIADEVNHPKMNNHFPKSTIKAQSYEADQMIDSSLWLMIEEAFADFIGMEYLKTEIFKQASLLQVQQLRAEYGIVSSIKPSRHMVFQGSPGTGKTTVARIIADIYFELGLLPTNNVVETDRSGLVGQYLGETAVKTAGVIDSAIGGVLFIDEAYSLTEGENNEYGKEAINTLLKMMEDHRDEMVVIVAGYQNEMHHFIDSNPGLKSRFNRTFDFHNYTPEELWMILELMCEKDAYVIHDNTRLKLKMLVDFEKYMKMEGERFANGRFVRNLFEKVIENQSFRVVVNNQLSKLDLMTLLECDFLNALNFNL